MTVTNMNSSRSGRKVPNQFIISGTYKGHSYTLFQSYSSPIALKYVGKVFLFPKWDYSTTTSRYRNEFLYSTTEDTRKLIESGKYILVDHESVDTVLAHNWPQ